MELAGFIRPSEVLEGGVSALYLADAGDLASCSFDTVTGVYTGVTFREGAAFAEFQFMEESASCRQSLSGAPPVASVVHELSFTLAGTAPGSTDALQYLYDAGRGFVSLVCMSDGGVYLVGWSPRWEQECPLRPVSMCWSTGARFEDDPSCRVTLRSEDTSFSKPFAGAIPARGLTQPIR